MDKDRERWRTLAEGYFLQWFVGWLLNVPATCYCISGTGICSDDFTCCHTELEVADQTFHLTQ